MVSAALWMVRASPACSVSGWGSALVVSVRAPCGVPATIPPPTNFGIEIWASPQDYLETGRIGIAGGSGGWLLSSGQFGGVAIRVVDNGDGTSSIEGGVINGNYNNMIKIGDAALADTNKWTHFAIVNENGTNTFYVNGVASGAASDTNTASAGDMYCGTPDDNQAFDGFLDEARVFTFAPGQFSTNDLLLRPVGPLIVNQPQSATVWDGGAVPFSVTASLNNNLTYQWRRGGANIGGATAATIFLPLVTGADNGNTFDCVVSDGSLSVTSSPATLSIATPNATDVAFYRSAINAEASLLAYFPADNNTGLTLSNSKDPSRNGTLELNATYDGRTNRAFGQRSVAFNANGGVQIPANPAYEFAGGNGTIEALVYLTSSTLTDQTIFALATDGGEDLYYALRISRDGGSLVYSNDATGQLSWTLPGNRVGKWAHVALVIDNLTNVTPFLDGQSLGSKAQVGFGATPGAPAWIGPLGTSVADFRLAGTVDELAVYGSALSKPPFRLTIRAFSMAPTLSARQWSVSPLPGRSSPAVRRRCRSPLRELRRSPSSGNQTMSRFLALPVKPSNSRTLRPTLPLPTPLRLETWLPPTTVHQLC